MDLSLEVPADTLDSIKLEEVDTLGPKSCQLSEDNDVIDPDKLDFSDDENWLCECSRPSVDDLQEWLYIPEDASVPIKTIKNIDTRTFTRPKKRFTRPSIEKYNEELYGNDVRELADSGIQLNELSQDEIPTKPLHFDLGQPTSSFHFDNLLANAPMLDSFQNMSPPSLVNSMCSSTFANLMENSFIKNDPELREIRDTDFTGSILQQEVEPMIQSTTESYSSLNSDIPEQFLKKVSFIEEEDKTEVVNETFAKEDIVNQTIILNGNLSDDSLEETKQTRNVSFNGTYQRLPKSTNLTFQRRKSTNREDLNTTITLSEKPESRDQKSFENIKRLLDRRPSPSLDLNRLSYLVESEQNTTFKRNSFGSSDSGENLDYMSLSSSSGSKPQSTDGLNDLDAQIMSTPKPRAKTRWSNHEISPIRDRNSDPELSSIDQHTTPIRKQKSVGHIAQKIPNPKSVNTLRIGKKPSNLNSMGHALKGSYTSLKPTNPNLPVAPPPLDTTVVLKNPAVLQVAPQFKREVSKEAQFVKPQPPRSGLPRPVTGIPRPVSRIPGPKSAGQRRH